MTNNKTTKTTALMLAGVLATSCFVGGTLARYVTTTSSEDSARVAVWGINADDVEMNLFASEYDVNGNKVAKSWDGDKIIAPGTSMSSQFSIVNLDDTLAPEVMYEIIVDVDDTEIDQRILDNPSIQWKLDNGTWGTWEATKADILALSGDASGRKVYQALEIADEFANGKTHTIAWQWMLDDNHAQDTQMGNEATAGDITAKISVKVTARQVQEDTVIATEGAASLNGVAYDTLQSAIDAAAVGDTVYLTESVEESVTIAEGQNITLNLNGYNISGLYEEGTDFDITDGYNRMLNYSAITNKGNLTITGSGTIDGRTDSSNALFNMGTANIKGGTFTRSTEYKGDTNVEGTLKNSAYTILNVGTMTIYDGAYIKTTGIWASSLANGNSGNPMELYNATGDLIIEGGIIEGGRHGLASNQGTVTINGGTIKSGSNANCKDAIGHDKGTLTINGGTITSTTGVAITADPGTEIVINSANITGDINSEGVVTDNR